MTTRYSLAGTITFDAYLRESAGEGLAMARRLAEQGLPIAHGWVVVPRAIDTLEDTVVRARDEAEVVRVSQPTGQVPPLWVSEHSEELTRWRGAIDTERSVLVTPLEGGAHGKARSTSDQGDADEVRVWAAGKELPWRVDRRSTCVSEAGEGLERNTVEAVADLVDRVQLAEGQPVEIDWGMQGGRPVLLGCAPLRFGAVPGPADGAWRRVSLTLDDEGTVVPLAIDTLDRAFRSAVDGREPVVERVFARPYRRRGRPTERSGVKRLGGAAAHAARVSAEAAPLFADVQRHSTRFAERRGTISGPHADLSDEALTARLIAWQELAAEPLLLLDRTRVANREVLGAIESAVGALPRDIAVALSMPQFSARRHAVHAELTELARLSDGRSASALDGEARAAWKRARAALSEVRALGIDVRPQAFGASNAGLTRAIARRFDERADAREEKRASAASQVLEQGRRKALGLPRVALAQTLLVLLRQLTRAKGALAESLATSLLGVRRTALEAGRRLEEEAILDEPDDALYLSAKEIRKALGGNVAGYAARVRARREDDLRWANFAAPRRLGDGA